MGENYRRVMSFFYGQPWALTPAKFAEIEAVLQARSAGERLSDEEIAARVGHGQREPMRLWDVDAEAFMAEAAGGGAARGGVVSVVGIYGTLTHRAGMFTKTSGLASSEEIANRIRAAAADPGVRAIVLDVDSPGGSVFGLQEASDVIRAARAAKPVKAVANANAHSAAYWLAAQADEVFVTPSGMVGSIGIIAKHVDQSEANTKLGLKVTTVTYGKNKGMGDPDAPLTEDARAQLEDTARKFGIAFEQAVAKGRGVPVETVRSDFGQGLSFMAGDAKERGLVDGIATLDEVIRRAARAKVDAAPQAAEIAPPDDRVRAAVALRGLL